LFLFNNKWCGSIAFSRWGEGAQRADEGVSASRVARACQIRTADPPSLRATFSQREKEDP